MNIITTWTGQDFPNVTESDTNNYKKYSHTKEYRMFLEG